MIPLTRLDPPHFCVCLKAWISSIICSDLFTFNGLELEAIVCFVDIDQIIDRHCLNFLFIIMMR